MSTVKTVLSNILGGKKCCRILQFSRYQNVLPNVYFGISSTLMDRPNPICHLISALFSLLHFKFPLHPTYATSFTYYIKKKKECPKLTVLIIIQFSIHVTELHMHFGVAIFTVHLHNFTL